MQYKKNLKRKIEVEFPEMNFLKLQNDKLLIYPNNIEKDTVIDVIILRKNMKTYVD